MMYHVLQSTVFINPLSPQAHFMQYNSSSHEFALNTNDYSCALHSFNLVQQFVECKMMMERCVRAVRKKKKKKKKVLIIY